MAQPTQPISPLRQRMTEDMRLRKLVARIDVSVPSIIRPISAPII